MTCGSRFSPNPLNDLSPSKSKLEGLSCHQTDIEAGRQSRLGQTEMSVITDMVTPPSDGCPTCADSLRADSYAEARRGSASTQRRISLTATAPIAPPNITTTTQWTQRRSVTMGTAVSAMKTTICRAKSNRWMALPVSSLS